MSIGGGIKFFDQSYCLLKDGSSITATTGNSAANYAIDRNVYTYWRSVGSDDTITETIEVTFDVSRTISRILLLDHNFKDFNVKYDVAGVWTHFSSVIGLDGSKVNITETAFADNTAYYEFSSVTTTKIQINVLKTQTVDAEKYISQIIATTELGTLNGYPEISDISLDKNDRVSKTISGRVVVQKSEESVSFSLDFKDYPVRSPYTSDINLMMDLFDRDDPFMVWLCGGRRGTQYFRYTLRGFRLKDVYTMQVVKELPIGYSQNIYINQINMKVVLSEHI